MNTHEKQLPKDNEKQSKLKASRHLEERNCFLPKYMLKTGSSRAAGILVENLQYYWLKNQRQQFSTAGYSGSCF
jgi:hypothetical protein